ncbi:Na+/H+ antiporter [Paenibacillus sp. NPDC058071]|uniref:Na+/H+ antiporter n=1 Tax=Paenibacillus sp. NPDC058071 TaxID=3346326 RepID=UPI0036D9403D
MELLIAILILITLIAVSHVVNRLVPFVPVPIIQIALGAAVALLPVELDIPLDPELFMVLFIAPLLFNDGKVTPRDELWKLRAPILLLAVGLVFVTVLIGGYTIHQLIPTIPLAAAFGLAAILSPTDAVAVSSMASRVHLPRRIHRLLEGEALMNDASGLVAFRFAIAATVTGVFSLWQAAYSFVIIALGGLLFGAVFGLFIIWVRALLRRFGMEDVTVHMMIVLITPFLLYILAEELGLSGILAAVAGGIVHAVERDKIRKEEIELRIVSDSTWSVALFILNGFVFMLLGLHIPVVMEKIFIDTTHNNLLVVGYVILLYLLLLAIRFVWLLLSTHMPSLFSDNGDAEKVSWLSIALLSISGVRGTLTLAGAFSIPLFLANGEVFPERDLILFLAAGVILLSLITASILLPLLASRTQPEEEHSQSSVVPRDAVSKAIQAAIQTVQLARNEQNEAAASAVLSSYHQQLAMLQSASVSAENGQALRGEELGMRRIALEAEKKALSRFLEEESVDPAAAKRLQSVLSTVELALTNRFRMLWVLFKGLAGKLGNRLFPGHTQQAGKMTAVEKMSVFALGLRTAEAAVKELKQAVTPENRAVAYKVISHYNRRIAEMRKHLRTNCENDQFEEQKKELQLACLQAERNELQCLYENARLTRKQLHKLQMMVNYREADIIEQNMSPSEG